MNFFRKNKKMLFIVLAMLTLSTGIAQDLVTPKGDTTGESTSKFWGVSCKDDGVGGGTCCRYAFWIENGCFNY